MKKLKHTLTGLCSLLLMFATQASFAQDSSKFLTLYVDSIPIFHWDTTTTLIVSSSCNFFLLHDSTKENYRLYKKHQKLISAEPTEKNCTDYFMLACALWEIYKTAESESLFLKIMDSDLPAYNISYRHSSDIPGDTITNSYGYGSYTSHYKHTAS